MKTFKQFIEQVGKFVNVDYKIRISLLNPYDFGYFL